MLTPIPQAKKLRVGVYKFSSCDGCQLAFLNLGRGLLTVADAVELVHFAEAGPLDPDAPVDVAFIEGSISTPDEKERIQAIREKSRFLITIGACATSGGIQALRNGKNLQEWMSAIYAKPEYINSLETSTAIALHVKVDLEIWGCPISSEQITQALRALLFGVHPAQQHHSVCIECKRQDQVCVMVTQQQPCLGPVTQTGCGALCPSVGRGCYGCYGPAEHPNTDSIRRRFAGFGLMSEAISRQFAFINNQAPAFKNAAEKE